MVYDTCVMDLQFYVGSEQYLGPGIVHSCKVFLSLMMVKASVCEQKSQNTDLTGIKSRTL
jgi:hypothetical protein